MAFYREAIVQLDGNSGIEIELEEADNPKRVVALTNTTVPFLQIGCSATLSEWSARGAGASNFSAA